MSGGLSGMSPSRVSRRRAGDLAGFDPPAVVGYLFREHGDSDDAWKLVKTRPIWSLRPHDGTFLPEVVTVKFADGTERLFNPEDQVEICPP
jgi:hypothetical protein